MWKIELNNLESLSGEIEERVKKIIDRLDRLVKENVDLEDRLNKALAKNVESE